MIRFWLQITSCYLYLFTHKKQCLFLRACIFYYLFVEKSSKNSSEALKNKEKASVHAGRTDSQSDASHSNDFKPMERRLSLYEAYAEYNALLKRLRGMLGRWSKKEMRQTVSRPVPRERKQEKSCSSLRGREQKELLQNGDGISH